MKKYLPTKKNTLGKYFTGICLSLLLLGACEDYINLNLIFTSEPSNIGGTTAQIEGLITDYKTSILQHGHCYSLNPQPTVNDFKTELGMRTETGLFVSSISGLRPNTLYYVRAYFITDETIQYSNQITMQTSIQNTELKDFRVETDSRLSNITQQSATSFGTLVTGQSVNITQYGHIWAIQPNPNLSNLLGKSELGAVSIENNRDFSGNMGNLSAGTKYYYCAYATDNQNFTYYGTVREFTTPN
jgi:hypothetical protein